MLAHQYSGSTVNDRSTPVHDHYHTRQCLFTPFFKTIPVAAFPSITPTFRAVPAATFPSITPTNLGYRSQQRQNLGSADPARQGKSCERTAIALPRGVTTEALDAVASDPPSSRYIPLKLSGTPRFFTTFYSEQQKARTNAEGTGNPYRYQAFQVAGRLVEVSPFFTTTSPEMEAAYAFLGRFAGLAEVK
jgi:hypothetical protein